MLFIGDLITDCGRTRPLGQRSGNGLGQGYVSLIDSILGAAIPERPLRVLNTGIGGNRVTDLAARWQTDVLDLEPHWLSVMISGMVGNNSCGSNSLVYRSTRDSLEDDIYRTCRDLLGDAANRERIEKHFSLARGHD